MEECLSPRQTKCREASLRTRQPYIRFCLIDYEVDRPVVTRQRKPAVQSAFDIREHPAGAAANRIYEQDLVAVAKEKAAAVAHPDRTGTHRSGIVVHALGEIVDQDAVFRGVSRAGPAGQKPAIR